MITRHLVSVPPEAILVRSANRPRKARKSPFRSNAAQRQTAVHSSAQAVGAGGNARLDISLQRLGPEFDPLTLRGHGEPPSVDSGPAVAHPPSARGFDLIPQPPRPALSDRELVLAGVGRGVDEAGP